MLSTATACQQVVFLASFSLSISTLVAACINKYIHFDSDILSNKIISLMT